jgi:HSP20 family molecular chaperone IbpA
MEKNSGSPRRARISAVEARGLLVRFRRRTGEEAPDIQSSHWTMPFLKLSDQIEQLFDQMIREPWSRPMRPRGSGPTFEERYLELEVPVGDCERGHMAVTVEDRQLTVTLRRRQRPGEGSGPSKDQHLRKSFSLPEDTDVGAIEARFDADVLRIRVRLRNRANHE